MPEDHFGERVAERYDEWSADMFDPAVVEPVVDFLADLAGDGAARPAPLRARLGGRDAHRRRTTNTYSRLSSSSGLRSKPP